LYVQSQVIETDSL